MEMTLNRHFIQNPANTLITPNTPTTPTTIYIPPTLITTIPNLPPPALRLHPIVRHHQLHIPIITIVENTLPIHHDLLTHPTPHLSLLEYISNVHMHLHLHMHMHMHIHIVHVRALLYVQHLLSLIIHIVLVLVHVHL